MHEHRVPEWFADRKTIEGDRMSRRENRTARRDVAPAAAVLSSAAAVLVLWSAPGVSADPIPGFPADEHGYVNTGARCDDGQTLLMSGRTARALVAVCVGPDGQLQYRGVRLSDRAELVLGASRGPDGSIIARNDDVTYDISPAAFLVSDGDAVLYRDAWADFRQPRLPAGPPPTSSSAPSTSTAPSSSVAPSSSTPPPPTTTPTVSTTTVTPSAPKPSGG